MGITKFGYSRSLVAPGHGGGESIATTGRSYSFAAKLAAAALSIIANAGCGTVETVAEAPCSPIVSCPDLSAFEDTGGIDPYKHGADLRTDTSKADWEQIRVCESAERTFCKDGETPETNSCEYPVCENAKACDPIPSRKNHEPFRTPDRVYFPKSSDQVYLLTHLDEGYNPLFFDNTYDCAPNETAAGGTTIFCDPIATCSEEKLIPYCDPLPRCAPGESPISCNNNGKPNIGFDSQNDCLSTMNQVQAMFNQYHIDVSGIAPAACGDVNKLLIPNLEVVCLPIPECAPGERPKDSTLTAQIDCGLLGSWQSIQGAPSCDPIKSCK